MRHSLLCVQAIAACMAGAAVRLRRLVVYDRWRDLWGAHGGGAVGGSWWVAGGHPAAPTMWMARLVMGRGLRAATRPPLRCGWESCALADGEQHAVVGLTPDEADLAEAGIAQRRLMELGDG